MKLSMENIPGGITAVDGFEAAGVACGLKKNGEKDFALLFCREPAVAAAVFTTNKFKAPPLLITEQHLVGTVRAVAVNSGIANACTGEQGLADARLTAALVAGKLGLQAEEVLVASTGVIGFYLPMDKITQGVEQAASSLSPNGGSDAAQAIMTTDTVIKESAVRFFPGNGLEPFVIAGMAKGSGMICPDMATMLAFLTTDLNVEQELLQEALHEAVDHSFNLISVDGDTSTNDMVLLLARDGTGSEKIDKRSPLWPIFQKALGHLCRELAYKVVADGEGLTKLIKLTVRGAVDYEMGRRLARSVLNSSLVKTAFFGEDANWGRIITAMGYAGVDFIPQRVTIFLGDVQVTDGGKGLIFDEVAAKAVLMQKEVPVFIDLNMGDTEITAWGNDLSHEYININSDYRS